MTIKQSKPFTPDEIAAHQYVIALESGYDLSYDRRLQVYSGIHLGEILDEVPELKDEAIALGNELNEKLRKFTDKFVTKFLEKIATEVGDDDDNNDAYKE